MMNTSAEMLSNVYGGCDLDDYRATANEMMRVYDHTETEEDSGEPLEVLGHGRESRGTPRTPCRAPASEPFEVERSREIDIWQDGYRFDDDVRPADVERRRHVRSGHDRAAVPGPFQNLHSYHSPFLRRGVVQLRADRGLAEEENLT
jgi:hypothetical protein